MSGSHSPNSHRGKYLRRIRSLSSSQGGTCSPPSTPWLLSFSTHWRGVNTHAYKHTQSCHQSLVINRVNGQWCKAADFELKATSPRAAVSWKKMKSDSGGRIDRTEREWKVQITEPRLWRSAELNHWNQEGKCCSLPAIKWLYVTKPPLWKLNIFLYAGSNETSLLLQLCFVELELLHLQRRLW